MKWIMPIVLLFQISVISYNLYIDNIDQLFFLVIASTLFTTVFIAINWKDLKDL